MQGSFAWIDLVAIMLFGVQAVLPPLAVAMLVSGLDDLLVDVLYFRLWLRRRRARQRHGAVTADALPAPHRRQPLAVFIPAWNESMVIGSMLKAALTAWQGDAAITLFVGWYVNDPATGREVAQVAAGDARIRSVPVPRAGPTTKADCLNHLWAYMLDEEARLGHTYLAVVLHDAEDAVSTAEPDVVRHLIARRAKACVQFPVLPVPVRGSPMVSGHYVDEFAEIHAKDLPLREAMGAPLPAAGVGCAFARHALAEVARERGGLPFDADSLTEDYVLGLRLSASGAGAFVRLATSPRGALVATREHFPDDFFAAVRQKARWLTGIALQGWDQFGWRGSLAARYWFLRDRKALFAFYLNLSCYLIVLLLLTLWLWQALDPAAPGFAPVAGERWLKALLGFNAMLLFWRLLVRALFVWRAAGLRQALFSLPRSLVANAINVAAAFRALRLYMLRGLGMQRLVWDHTRHHLLPDARP